MAAMELTGGTLNDFLARIERIESDSARQWGTKSAPEMIAHLNQAVGIGMGEIKAEDTSNFLTRNVMRPIVFSGLFEWPKGKINSPDLYHPQPADDFDAAKSHLADLLKQFIERCEKEPDSTFPHPLFGNLTVAKQQRVFGMHTDHHLRQFGV